MMLRGLQGTALMCVGLAVCAAPAAPAAAQAAQPAEGRSAGDSLALVHGTVVAHGSGAPLAEVAVSLASGPGGTRGIGTRVTDQDGAFVFRDVPPGTYTLVLDLMGYHARRDTVRVHAGGDVRILAELSVSPVPLPPMVVVVRQQSDPAMAGFEQRRKTTAGTFITRKQIEDSPSPYVTDFLRMVPGATVVPAPSYGYDVRLRGGCRPDIWIDGARAGFTVSIDLLLAPMDVEGIEVYRGPELPGRFGNNPCGAIVIWTRRPERSTADGSILKHLAIVLGALFVVYLVSR